MDPLTLIATTLGIPFGKLLLKKWLESDVAAEVGGGLAEIAAVAFKDSFDQREAERQFIGFGELLDLTRCRAE